MTALLFQTLNKSLTSIWNWLSITPVLWTSSKRTSKYQGAAPRNFLYLQFRLQHLNVMMKSKLKQVAVFLLTAWEEKAKKTFCPFFPQSTCVIILNNHSSVDWFAAWCPWVLWKSDDFSSFIFLTCLTVIAIDKWFIFYLKGHRHICTLTT